MGESDVPPADDRPVTYPREDTCYLCGAHVGWVVSELGEIFALGICDDCTDLYEEDEEEEDGADG